MAWYLKLTLRKVWCNPGTHITQQYCLLANKDFLLVQTHVLGVFSHGHPHNTAAYNAVDFSCFSYLTCRENEPNLDPRSKP